MKLFTKESLIEEFKRINSLGWISNRREGNCGGIGNTLEDLLGIEENNLPIPNAAEWELKAQRAETTSLTTLFHMEPSPRACRFVPKILLAKYGWRHQEAGLRYNENEMSFRQTLHGSSRSDRGFIVKIDRKERKVLISFDADFVDSRHEEWKRSVTDGVGLGELDPQPYWGFDDLEHKAGTKLLNCFYVRADVRRDNGEERYHYASVTMLRSFDFERFLNQIEAGNVLVDFDARTGHNHGTKFRLKQNCLHLLYHEAVTVV